MGGDEQRIRSDAEQVRVQERLLIRGNTQAGVMAAVLKLVAHGREFPPDELRGYAKDLEDWAADVRAVASEEAP